MSSQASSEGVAESCYGFSSIWSNLFSFNWGGTKTASSHYASGSILSSEAVLSLLVKSPDMLIKFLEKAEQNELKKCSLTTGFPRSFNLQDVVPFI